MKNTTHSYKFQKASSFSIGSFIGDVFEIINVYGTQISLRILKRDKYLSPLGLAGSLTVLIICGIVFLNDVVDTIQRSNPKVVTSQINQPNPPAFQLNPKNFSISVVMTNMAFQGIKGVGTIYNVRFGLCTRLRLKQPNGTVLVNQTCVPIQAQECALERYQSESQKEFFKNYQFGALMCMNDTLLNTDPPVISGYINSEVYQYLTVMVTPCNSTIQACANDTVIEQTLTQGIYAAYLSTNFIDDSNAYDPFNEQIELVYSTFSKFSAKTMATYFNPVTTKTDVGLFAENILEEQAMTYDSTKEFTDVTNKRYLIYHILQLNNKQGIRIRSYDKVTDILGNVGGLWSVLYYGIFLLINPVISYLMNFSLTNQIFSFEPQHKEQSIMISQDTPNISMKQGFVQEHHQRKSQRLQHIRRIASGIDPKTKRNGSIRSATLVSQKTQKDPVKEFLKDRKKGLSLSLLDFVKMSFGGLKVERAQISYSMDKILQKLDTMYIIKKLYEIEKLKLILLDENQLKLFNYIPKPCIPYGIFENGETNEQLMKKLENQPQFKPIFHEEKTQIRKLEDALDAYGNINRKPKKSMVDTNLIGMMDPDIKELLGILGLDEEPGSSVELEELSASQVEVQKIPIFVEDEQDNVLQRQDQQLMDSNRLPGNGSPFVSPVVQKLATGMLRQMTQKGSQFGTM